MPSVTPTPPPTPTPTPTPTQGVVNFDIDPESTGNSANTLGTTEDCVRVDIPSPVFDGVSDYVIDIVVTGDPPAPVAYDAALVYDQTKVHVAEPDQLVKMPGAMSFGLDADSDGEWSAAAAYVPSGSGVPGNGTLVRVGLDIGGPGLVTFTLAAPPSTSYVSEVSEPDSLPITVDGAQLAVNMDCP